MPISGLVLVLDAPNGPFPGTLRELQSHAAIEVGETNDNSFAIVVDSISKQHDQEVWQWVQQLPGVIDIRVAFVGFDETTDDESGL